MRSCRRWHQPFSRNHPAAGLRPLLNQHVGAACGGHMMALMGDIDADGLSAIRRRWKRVAEQVASIVPTVRGRLSALVLMALVPALVILGFDAWLVRQRALASLTEVSTKVVRLMQRELDDRITRGAHRLDVLAADPDVIAMS